MDHARIVKQQDRPWLGEREALAIGSFGLEDAGLTTLHSLTIDEKHRDEIDTIAMRTFRRRAANAIGGINAKLVRLDKPGPLERFLHDGRLSQVGQRNHHFLPHRLRNCRVVHGLKPAQHAAV